MHCFAFLVLYVKYGFYQKNTQVAIPPLNVLLLQQIYIPDRKFWLVDKLTGTYQLQTLKNAPLARKFRITWTTFL